MQYLDSLMPRVSGKWRLRNDNCNLIAYKSTVENNTYFVLSPFEAIIVSLLDGNNTLLQIKNSCIDLFKDSIKDLESLEKKFYQTFHKLKSTLDFITYEGLASPSFKGNNLHLIADYRKYKYPVDRLERPIAVMLSFSERCAFDCIYCFAQRAKCKEFDFSRWLRLFEVLTENEVFLVDLGCPDIFARKDAFKLLEEMSARDFVFLVSTKSYISEQSAQKLSFLGIGRKDVPEYLERPIQISVDSTNNELSSTIVGHSDHFKSASESVKNLLKYGIKPRIKTVLTSVNANATEGIIEHFGYMGINEFRFVQYSRSIYKHNDNLFLSKKQKLQLANLSETLQSKYPHLNIYIENDTTIGGTRNLTREQWEERPVCSGGRSKMIVRANGDITLCDQTPMEPQFIVGNIFEVELLNIWNSQKLREFIYPSKEKFEGTVCYDCHDYDHCHKFKGYCYKDSYINYNNIYDAPPQCPYQSNMPLRIK